MKIFRANLISFDRSGVSAKRRKIQLEKSAALSRDAATFQEFVSAESAFTMVEIALCLAIIGFALIAIIGVLPAGLRVQRDNREETVISQDATYLMDAIRSGARGLDDLTNYVYAITNVVTRCNAAGVPDPTTTIIYGYTYTDYSVNNASAPPVENLIITNGARIIGLLSTPKYTDFGGFYDSFGQHVGFGQFLSNHVSAYVRAISGNASEKAPQDNADVLALAFNYKLISEVLPYSSYDTNWLNYQDPSIVGTPEETARSNNWLVAKNVHTNLYDLRLRFLWPLLPNGDVGNGRQSYRTMASGYLTSGTNPPFYHFESRHFAQDTRPPP